MKAPLHPELVFSGPEEFNLREMIERQPRHEWSGRGRETIRKVYERIRFAGRLGEHPNLADLVTIRDVYHREFHRLSPSDRLYGWRSVVYGEFSRLHIPYIYAQLGGIVVLDWAWMDDPF
jgi:hypothetical protein